MILWVCLPVRFWCWRKTAKKILLVGFYIENGVDDIYEVKVFLFLLNLQIWVHHLSLCKRPRAIANQIYLHHQNKGAGEKRNLTELNILERLDLWNGRRELHAQAAHKPEGK